MKKAMAFFLAFFLFFTPIAAPSCIAFADTGASLQLDSINSAVSGDRVTVCLRAEDLPAVCAMQFTIAYDDTGLDLISITVGSMFEKLSVPTINSEIAGKIILSWDTIGSALSGTGVMLKMVFSVTADEPSKLSIAFDQNEEFILCDTDYISIPINKIAGEVSVEPQITATQIILHSDDVWVAVNETMQLSSEVLPAEAANYRVVWSVKPSENEAGASEIDQSGLLTPLKAGKVIVRAEIDGNSDVYAEKTIIIYSPVAHIQIDKSFLTLSVNDSIALSVDVLPEEYSESIEWESSSESIVTVENGTLLARDSGSAYIVAKINLHGKEYSSYCRVDVIDGGLGDALLPSGAAHLAAAGVTSNIYSTNYASVDILFDIERNSAEYFSSESFEEPENTGHIVTAASFASPAKATDPDLNEYFHLRVADDRTLEIIPKIDLTDPTAVKALKSSYKSAIIVSADGVEYATPEALTIKVDKKLPTVKAAAVKLNSFFEHAAAELVLTSTAGRVLSVTVDESKATSRTPACPAWLELNDDLTVSVKAGSQNVKGSGKLYLLAEVEGYAVPLPASVSVSASPVKPTVKLSKTSVAMYQDTANSDGAALALVSTNRKADYSSLDITALRAATADDIAALSPRDQTAYAASTAYSVADYDVETGAFTLSTNGIAVKGKVLLIATVGGIESQTITFPLTVSVYTKAPTLKFSKSSLTLNTALTPELNLQSVTITPNPVDYALGGLEVRVTDSKNLPVDGWEDVLFVERDGNVFRVSSTANTPANMTYKVSICDNNLAKPVVLTVKTTYKAPTLKLSKATATLNQALGAGNDPFTLTVTPSHAGYDISSLVLTVLDGRGKNDITAQNVLDLSQSGNTLTLNTTENTAAGATYKVKVDLDGVAGSKPVMITVKTLSETKAASYAVSATLAAKGSIDISRTESGSIVITPKYKNYNAQDGHEETYAVTATNTAVRPNIVTDVTERFNITGNGDGTVTISLKVGSILDPSLKYAVSMSTDAGTGSDAQAVAAKPVSISIKMSTAKVSPSAKAVTLYRNDRYSEGVVKLSVPAGCAPIESVLVSETAAKPSCYDVTPLGNGEYAIGFRGDRITALTKAGSVKLCIFLEGNGGVKPNTTLSVSVKITEFK